MKWIRAINAIPFHRILGCEKRKKRIPSSGITVKLSKFYYFCCRVNQSECLPSIVFQSCSKSINGIVQWEPEWIGKKKSSPKTLNNIEHHALSKRIQFNTICYCVKCVADDNRCWITDFSLFSILSKRNPNENLETRNKTNTVGIVFTNCGPFVHWLCAQFLFSFYSSFHSVFFSAVLYFAIFFRTIIHQTFYF